MGENSLKKNGTALLRVGGERKEERCEIVREMGWIIG